MSLTAFQEGFGALIAAPELCRAVEDGASAALAQFNLTQREIRRLAAMVKQPGMAASWKLYRANRLLALHRFLPRTLALLGPVLRTEIDLFWRAHPDTRLQFEEDVASFVAFLSARIASGHVSDPLVADVLGFEAAACRLMFLRARIHEVPEARPISSKGKGDLETLHPLVAVTPFRREPIALLAAIDARIIPPPPEEPSEQFLLLDGRTADLTLSRLAVPIGRALASLQAGEPPTDVDALRRAAAAGLLL